MEIGIMPPQGKAKLAVDVDADIRQRIKILATVMNVPMGELVERLINGTETLDQLEDQYLPRK